MWRISPRLFLGDSISAKQLGSLKSNGIIRIVNCAATVPCYFKEEMDYLHVPISNRESFERHLNEIFAFVDEGRTSGSVMIHCSEGRDRSAAAVAAYLCHVGNTVDNALALLKEAVGSRRGAYAPPKFEYMAAVIDRFDLDRADHRPDIA